MRIPSSQQTESQSQTQIQTQTKTQTNSTYQPPSHQNIDNKVIQSTNQPNPSPNSSRFNSSGRLSSPNYPILPIQLDIMDLNGMEGLLVEHVS